MREFTKSLFSYSLALSLFPLRQVQSLLTPADREEPKGAATKAFDAVTDATTSQFGETLHSVFRVLDNVQRGIVSLTFSFLDSTGSGGRHGHEETTPQGDIHWNSEPVSAADLYRPENSYVASELWKDDLGLDG
jgi:hypothetical protein